MANEGLTLHLNAPSNILPRLKVLVVYLPAPLVRQTFDVYDDLPLEAVATDRERLVHVRRDGDEVLLSCGWADSDAKLGHF